MGVRIWSRLLSRNVVSHNRNALLPSTDPDWSTHVPPTEAGGHQLCEVACLGPRRHQHALLLLCGETGYT